MCVSNTDNLPKSSENGSSWGGERGQRTGVFETGALRTLQDGSRPPKTPQEPSGRRNLMKKVPPGIRKLMKKGRFMTHIAMIFHRFCIYCSKKSPQKNAQRFPLSITERDMKNLTAQYNTGFNPRKSKTGGTPLISTCALAQRPNP